MLHYKACARTWKEKAADIALGVFGVVAAVYTTAQTILVSNLNFLFLSVDRLMVSSMIAYGATVGPCFTYWEVWFLISGFLNVSVEFCESRTTLLYSWDATIATDLWWCILIPVVGEPQPQSITVNEMIHVHVIDGCAPGAHFSAFGPPSYIFAPACQAPILCPHSYNKLPSCLRISRSSRERRCCR